jgi:DNA-binding NarL/FixJ family response regulator
MQDTAKPATRVLIVDDHPVVLSGCRTLLAVDQSIRIDEASDAKSGHRAYISKRPDVTMIDIGLPDVSGFELMRRIRKDDPDAKIIMFSMNDDPAFVVRAVELGAQGYVSKGDDPVEGGAQGRRRRQLHLAAACRSGDVLRRCDQG